MLVTCTREQGAHFDGTMFRVAGTAHRRSCSALWTSWGEMWVEAVKKCYLSTWVPFPSFFFSSAKINFKKKKNLFRLLKPADWALALPPVPMAWTEERNVSWKSRVFLSVLSHTDANTIMSWSGSSAAHWRIQPGFVVSVCVFYTNLWEEEGHREGQN